MEAQSNATKLAPDPRVGVTPKYNREATIAAVTAFYQSLSTLPHFDLSDILYPPPTGWPNITKDSFSAYDKSEEVIELLRHLPYLNPYSFTVGSGPKGEYHGQCDYLLAPDTLCINYSDEKHHHLADGRIYNGEGSGPLRIEIPPWVVPLTRSVDNYGIWLLFDTTDGTATRYELIGYIYEPDYEQDDPRMWRDKCEDVTMRLKDYLGMWKEKWMSLTWLCVPGETRAHLWFHSPKEGYADDEGSQMQKILRAHGWPDDFRKEECKEALVSWKYSKEARNREDFLSELDNSKLSDSV